MQNGTTNGFKRSATLLAPQIRKVSETRGFAETRVLTHWEEIAGEEIAAIARPIDISYGRQGFGATLTVLTTGANAPILEMQKEALRARVNAIYGHNAIARIRITQTAPTGFSDGQVSFEHRQKPNAEAKPDPKVSRAAADLAAPVEDESLRRALENLGQNILSKANSD